MEEADDPEVAEACFRMLERIGGVDKVRVVGTPSLRALVPVGGWLFCCCQADAPCQVDAGTLALHCSPSSSLPQQHPVTCGRCPFSHPPTNFDFLPTHPSFSVPCACAAAEGAGQV